MKTEGGERLIRATAVLFGMDRLSAVVLAFLAASSAAEAADPKLKPVFKRMNRKASSRKERLRENSGARLRIADLTHFNFPYAKIRMQRCPTCA